MTSSFLAGRNRPLLLALFLLATAVPLLGQQTTAITEKPVEERQKAPSSAATAETLEPPPPADSTRSPGVRAFVDPITGQLTSQPTAEQKQELQRMVAASRSVRPREALTDFELSQGGVGVKLDDRFHSSLQLEFDQTGGWRLRCDDDDPESVQVGTTESALSKSVPRDANGNAVQ